MKKPKRKADSKTVHMNQTEEINTLNSWIESQKPDSGTNPLSFHPLDKKAPVGWIDDANFSAYVGSTRFDELPISRRTKTGLRKAGYVTMTDIQRAALPHSLCGRDILGAAKTGSGKTLAFVIPVLEKLYRERWEPKCGVGGIILSPTRELAGQLFDVLQAVGKHHNFSAGLLIGGRKEVDTEKERVNLLNILVCTPGRLLQHMNETPNFNCSELKVLVLDEADRLLDVGFKKALNAIVSELPKQRQTLLFSATQTKSVEDLARLSLKDPEYISVHEESVTATPNHLQQTAIIVPLDQKLDMLWSFIKAHLNSKILVFLSSRKQATFVFEAFKKLHPGIPLKCLHGKMKLQKRMPIYSQFSEKLSVLFSTDVVSRGLDFSKAVDWVVQVDCPDDVASYIHRVGRTARYNSGGRSILFLMPSEMKMLEKLQAAKIPIQLTKANTKRLQPVSGLLAALLVKYPDMQYQARRAFITYLRSIMKQKDKEVFDVMKLSFDEFSASLGLPMTPKVRLLNQKIKDKQLSGKPLVLELENNTDEQKASVILTEELLTEDFGEEKVDSDILLMKDAQFEEKASIAGDDEQATTFLKETKLKINVHRPLGSRVIFDDDGNTVSLLAMVANTKGADVPLDHVQNNEFHRKSREELKGEDKEDKLLDRQRRREKRVKEKMKWKRGGSDNLSGSEEEKMEHRRRKRSKVYFDIRSGTDRGSENGERKENKAKTDSISLEEQEAVALKLLNSMHS